MPLRVAQLGQPVLRHRAVDVPPAEMASAAFQEFLDQMHETLRAAEGAGLAAPQVFVSQRVFLAAIMPAAQEDAPPDVEFFINPQLVQLSADEASAWEGCLSFPELLVLVPRPLQVRVEYLNRHGQPMALELEGFPARVVQHEFDHLEGVLTIDRARSTHDIIKASEAEELFGK